MRFPLNTARGLDTRNALRETTTLRMSCNGTTEFGDAQLA